MTELRIQINKRKSFLPISTAIDAKHTRDPLKPNLSEKEEKDPVTCHASSVFFFLMSIGCSCSTDKTVPDQRIVPLHKDCYVYIIPLCMYFRIH